MNWLASHGITFLSGIFVGAAGKYLGDLFTDQRHRQEDARKAKESFRELSEKMPDLLREMRDDLSTPHMGLVREFFVAPEHAILNLGGKAFVYREKETNDYLAKTKILASCGHVVDITPGSAPMFRMAESFVTLLLRWRDSA